MQEGYIFVEGLQNIDLLADLCACFVGLKCHQLVQWVYPGLALYAFKKRSLPLTGTLQIRRRERLN